MARITKAQQAELDQQAIKDAQQAALKSLRAEKAAATRAANIKAKAEAAQPKVQEATPFDPKAEARKRLDAMASAVDAILADFEAPSWKRVLAATVISLVLAAGAGWMIGTLTGMLIVSAVALTGMAWIAWVIWALGMVIAFYAGAKIGQHVGGYIMRGDIDRHIGSMKDRVVGLFTSKPVEVTGAFTPSAAA